MMALILMTLGVTTPRHSRTLAWTRRLFRRSVKEELTSLQQAASCLTSYGHTVVTADTIAKARQHLSAAAPDVLVLDWRCMPDGLPFAVLDALAELQPANRTRVIFITVMDPRGEPMRLSEGLVDAYVLWSCSFWQVVLTVEQLLQPDRLRRTAVDFPDQ